MDMIQTNTRSLGLLIELNWDRILYVTAIALCWTLSAYVASQTFAHPSML